MSGQRAQVVLDFWFGPLPLTPERLAQRMQLWFGGDEHNDIRALRDEDAARRFMPLIRSAAAGELSAWQSSPRRQLALVLLLDALPQQALRHTAGAYAGHAQALQITLSGLRQGADATLRPLERLFYYLPLQHAESPELQEESVAAFRRLPDEADDIERPAVEVALAAAQRQQAIIRQFGRFPDRNAALGRSSTADELAFLSESGSR